MGNLFGEIKGLGQIPIRPGFQPLDTMLNLSALGENQHTRSAASSSELLENLDAIKIREAQVENNQVIVG